MKKSKLLTKDFVDLWKELWGEYIISKYVNEEKISKNKFLFIKEGINNKDESFNLQDLIKNSNSKWTTPEWGFPKGRRNYQENDINCSLREFEEETGYSKNSINIIQNILPYEEIFLGSNFKSYKHKYYLAFMKNLDNTQNYQISEVSNMKWMTYEECLKHIRPYNLERIKILNYVENMLNKYNLI